MARKGWNKTPKYGPRPRALPVDPAPVAQSRRLSRLAEVVRWLVSLFA
jgi:hypothetical protein